MFSSFTEVKSGRRSLSLPAMAASHALNSRTATIATLTSYANSLIYKYPEQYHLINDIVTAGLSMKISLSGENSIEQLQDQLIDLERYLVETKY